MTSYDITSVRPWCDVSFSREECSGTLHARVSLYCWHSLLDFDILLFQWSDGDWLIAGLAYGHRRKAVEFCHKRVTEEWSKLIDSMIAADSNFTFSSNGVIAGAPRDA